MTVDVYTRSADEALLEDIEEIMEDTMVQMFILHPSNATELKKVQEQASAHGSLFYAAPLSLLEEADENCVGYRLEAAELRELPHGIGKPYFIDESLLDDAAVEALAASGAAGIVLNATRPWPKLGAFRLAIGPDTVETFDPEALAALDMDTIVLQSRYPDHGFDELYTTAKKISDTMFRPEQSIIARATKSSLELFGFRR